MTNDGTVTVGSTALVFTQFSGAGQVTAGSALTKSGNTLNVAVDDSSIEVNYPAKLSFKDLAKQYIIYGAGRCFIFKKHGKFTSFRQLIPLVYLVTYLCIFCLSLLHLKFIFFGILLFLVHLFFIIIFNISDWKSLKKLYY